MKNRTHIAIALLLLAGTVNAGTATLHAQTELPPPPGTQGLPNAAEQARIAARLQADAASRNTPSADSASSGPTLKQNPLTTLKNFEPAADQEYRLGRGDSITVDFAGRPEMQAKLVVGPDGRISLPLAGEVLVADLTRSEAAKAIEAALGSYFTNVSAQVTVTLYTSNRVMLLGAVEHPGILTFDGTPTLLEAITRGGLPLNNSGNGNTIIRSSIPEECAIYRGNDQVVWVQLRELMASGNSLANLRLRRDDVVYVPSPLERIVSVLGEVQHPGAVPLTHSTSTLASVLAEAGGVTDHAGNNPHIQVVDPAKGTSRVMTYKEAMDPVKSLEITLKPGEIIYVPKSGFYKATYVLERLNPMVEVMSMAFYAGAL